MSEIQKPYLETKDICKYFQIGNKALLHAVDHVNLQVFPGETVGLVGESGCGKSTLGRTIIRMYEQTSGELIVDGKKIPNKLNMKDRRQYSRIMQMIFQDPFASLNPRMTVGDIIAEGADIHRLWNHKERVEKVNYWLNKVGMVPEHASRFAHEFSGGQRQRIGIARSLAVEPKFIVCDEPISALDVSIQAQVVMLLKQLQEELGLTYLFIAHGLHMVRYISNRTAVMYLGQLVEVGPSEEVFLKPYHPYTKALMSSNPYPDPDREKLREREVLRGEVTSPVNPKPGCRFAARCPYVKDICRQQTPPLRELEKGRQVACHLAEQVSR